MLSDQRFLRLVDDFVVVIPGSSDLFLDFGLLLALGHRCFLGNILLNHFVLAFYLRIVPFHLAEDFKQLKSLLVVVQSDQEVREHMICLYSLW